MSSPQRPLPALSYLDVTFWLPPGGIDNGVFASFWAELADLEESDVEVVLTMLAAAGVGGYIATPSGMRDRGIRRLWVDSLQYHRAEDVLMTYLHERGRASIMGRQKTIEEPEHEKGWHRWLHF